MKVKLTHICHKKGCEGMPGDMIDVSPEDAAWLVQRGGAIAVVEGTPKPQPEKVEAATKEPEENAATRTKPPKKK